MLITLWRSVLLYALVIIVLRFMGKRQIGELQPSELVTTIMISNIAAIPIENAEMPLVVGIMPIIALACLEVLGAAAAMKSQKVRHLIVGRPRWIIRDGKVDQKQLAAMRWSIDDLMEQLRTKGVFDLSEVHSAVAETNGELSVWQNFLSRPLTAKEMNLSPPANEAPPEVVIGDGVIFCQTLSRCGVTEKWLKKRLGQEGLRAEDVFLMTCDRDKHCVIIRKEGIS